MLNKFPCIHYCPSWSVTYDTRFPALIRWNPITNNSRAAIMDTGEESLNPRGVVIYCICTAPDTTVFWQIKLFKGLFSKFINFLDTGKQFLVSNITLKWSTPTTSFLPGLWLAELVTPLCSEHVTLSGRMYILNFKRRSAELYLSTEMSNKSRFHQKPISIYLAVRRYCKFCRGDAYPPCAIPAQIHERHSKNQIP